MGCRAAAVLLALAVSDPAPASGAIAAAEVGPIGRVVALLEGLAKKVENDGKNEENMFENYQCWYKTVVSTKEASNSAAAERIKNLESYIADIAGGKIEFTNEREDLEKEAAGLQAEIDQSTALRNSEERDFLAAKDEMENAIESLEEAVQVLADGTEGATLLSISGQLSKVVAVGQSFLKKDDMATLSSALQPEHNMKYKAGSSKIQEILQDMLETFKDNLADAIKMNKEKIKTFDTLMTSKNTQLSAAQTALADASSETGSRTLNKDEANQEKESLEDQKTRDETYIAAAEASYKTMTEQWDERKRLRTAEVASIMEAAGVLTSDEARDVTKKSFSSQGFDFLQFQAAGACRAKRVAKAKDALKRTAMKSKDLRVSLLAVDLGLKGHFDAVVSSVDEMISTLHSESDADLETKEKCEKDRDDNTAIARRTSYAVDDQTAEIVRKKHQVDELNAKIAAAEAAIADANAKLDEATKNRAIEKNEFESSKADDEAAKHLVEKASQVLLKFYEDNGLVLAQRRAGQAPVVVAGEAPPPPPSMWKEPYGGAKGEGNGIQTILEFIAEDIQKDIEQAEAAEESAIQDYNDFKTETEEAIQGFNNQITGYEEEVAECEKDIESARTQRKDKRETMDGALAYLRSISNGCDYMAANFDFRQQNRYDEIDGLLEAEASLQGGVVKGSAAALMQDKC